MRPKPSTTDVAGSSPITAVPSRCQPVARICGAITVSYAPAAWSDSAARSSWKCMRSCEFCDIW